MPRTFLILMLSSLALVSHEALATHSFVCDEKPALLKDLKRSEISLLGEVNDDEGKVTEARLRLRGVEAQTEGDAKWDGEVFTVRVKGKTGCSTVYEFGTSTLPPPDLMCSHCGTPDNKPMVRVSERCEGKSWRITREQVPCAYAED